MGQPALLDGKAAVELLGYAPAPGLGGVLVYLSVENLSGKRLRHRGLLLAARKIIHFIEYRFLCPLSRV